MTTQTVTFGAGCFWGVEYVFRRVPGRDRRRGRVCRRHHPNPTYQEVCSHTTGHAEVLRVMFDDEQVSFDQLLEVFWAMHDPTQVNRQGPDVGDQYRSVIFTTHRRAAGGRGGLEGARAGAVRPPDRDRDPAGAGVLPGRGLPPGLLREERPHAVLPRGAGQGPRGAGTAARSQLTDERTKAASPGSPDDAASAVRAVPRRCGRRPPPAPRAARSSSSSSFTSVTEQPAMSSDVQYSPT